jgi:hypothetical protein
MSFEVKEILALPIEKKKELAFALIESLENDEEILLTVEQEKILAKRVKRFEEGKGTYINEDIVNKMMDDLI